MTAQRIEELRALGPSPGDWDGDGKGGSWRPADIATCWHCIEQLDEMLKACSNADVQLSRLRYQFCQLVSQLRADAEKTERLFSKSRGSPPWKRAAEQHRAADLIENAFDLARVPLEMDER
jgi:hypothetical protein